MPRRKAPSPRSHPREKQVELLGDRLMAVLGFTAIRFSQARATMQTPGIPDRLFISPLRNSAVWWEAKTTIGRPSAFQVAFRGLVESVGWEYVLGTDEALVDWAVGKGFCERLPNGLRVVPVV